MSPGKSFTQYTAYGPMDNSTIVRYAANMNSEWKTGLGRKVRELRQSQRWTLKQLAEKSGLSARFLTEVEAGRANPSLASLLELAAALDAELWDLLEENPQTEAQARLLGLVRTLEPPAAARALTLLEQADLRSNPLPIALVGLRGAGKSSVGARLADHFERPFLELDRLIEVEAGMSLGDLFELHGEARVREHEAEVLEQVLKEEPTAILATGGGLVTHESTWQMLYRNAFTVWLKANPQTHWDRVVAQGDQRPMQNRSRARAELEALYAARAPLYSRAHAIVDTDTLALDDVVAELIATSKSDLSPLQGGKSKWVPASA